MQPTRELYEGKDYEKFVMDYTLKDIMGRFNVNKKKARMLFFNALASNIVANEISDNIEFLLEQDFEVKQITL